MVSGGILQKRGNLVYHGFKYVFQTFINEGQIHSSIILKETQLDIILRNAMLLSLNSLIQLSFKKSGNLNPTFVKLKCEQLFVMSFELD